LTRHVLTSTRMTRMPKALPELGIERVGTRSTPSGVQLHQKALVDVFSLSLAFGTALLFVEYARQL